MIGISVSPFVAGLFENFRLSFLIALALFAIALLYLLVFVGGTKPNQSSNPHVDDDEMTQAEGTAGTSSPTIIPWRNCFASSLSPLGAFQKRPIAMLSGLSLLIYNVGQSYIFSAIMVYTSTRFGFSAKQNGILVSIAHAASATYLFSALFAVPRILQFLRRSRPIVHSPLPLVDIPQTADTIFALLSLIMQSISLVSLALATKDWQVYPIITVFAVGLAAPSFIKSHCVALFSADDAPQVVAALAIAETTGGLLAPVLLGGWQAMWPESGVFLVAATTMGISAVFFFVGALVGRINRRRTRL